MTGPARKKRRPMVTRAEAREGRLIARTLEAVSHEKAQFIGWLNEHGNGPEHAAELLTKMKACPDPRVQIRALELEAKIRGFFDDEPAGARGVNIVVNIGIPKTRDVPRRVVVAQDPAEPKP